ncbi:hypothetical protein F66182_4384 [Fusarium sp. NRRL 66182]|nr:hypothetical protein F66182_4384 [Fusarium sp. NRRL 66182]
MDAQADQLQPVPEITLEEFEVEAIPVLVPQQQQPRLEIVLDIKKHSPHLFEEPPARHNHNSLEFGLKHLLISKLRSCYFTMFYPPKVLLAMAVLHGFVATGLHVPVAREASIASAVQDETAPLAERDETGLVTRDEPSSDVGFVKNKPRGTGLEPRAWDYLGADARRRVHMGDKGIFYASYPMSIYGLYKACLGWHQGDPTVSVLCVYGAITSIWTTFLIGDKAITTLGSLGQQLLESWYNGKRDLAVVERDVQVRSLIDGLSKEIGADVQHLGFWHDDTPAKNIKRSMPEGHDGSIPVFSAKLHGHNFHFAHRGTIDGKPVIRFGFSGDDEEADKLSRRYDKPYFERGGLDFLIEAVQGLEPGFWKDDDEHFNWIFEQVKCLMGTHTIWGGTKVADASGVYFQMYDNMKDGTVAAAMMAPFEDGKKSAIHEMVTEGGIDYNRQRTPTKPDTVSYSPRSSEKEPDTDYLVTCIRDALDTAGTEIKVMPDNEVKVTHCCW